MRRDCDNYNDCPVCPDGCMCYSKKEDSIEKHKKETKSTKNLKNDKKEGK